MTATKLKRPASITKPLIAIVATSMSLGGAFPAIADGPFVLTYKDRSIDSAPYTYAFPYRVEKVSIQHNKLYFSRHVEGEGKYLFVTDWDASTAITLDSSRATKVTSVDLNSINFWRRAYNTSLQGLVAEADDDKAERVNLWHFPDGADTPKKLTDVDFVYDFDQAPDHSAVYYTARYGTSDAAKGCLEKLTINPDGTTESRPLICDDSPDMPAKINWWSSLRADEKRVVFPALKDGDRNKQELYAYDFADGTVSQIFVGHGKSWVTVRNNWGDDTQALITAGRDLYRYDFESKTSVHLKTFDRSISNIAPAGPGAAPAILLTTETPFETELNIVSIGPETARVVSKTTVAADAWLADGHNGTVLVGTFSPEIYASFELLTFKQDGTYETTDAIEGLAEVNQALQQCEIERIKVLHDDTSEVSPGAVATEAFVYRPKTLPRRPEQKFIITAYYGGGNQFSSYHHIWCALGITTISPAVRGDWRFGTEFANSNDREKADAPVRDVLALARHIIERYNIPSSRQVGTVGYSHGGWAAVRALSYPGPERLDLGFAIAGGGFYDLPAVVDPTQTDQTNIHGWFDKEFGTAGQTELLEFMSPSRFIFQIDAPVFLYHGERDTRVSPQQSKSFSALLDDHGKPNTLMLLPDQGHSINDPQTWAQIRQAMLDFIADLP